VGAQAMSSNNVSSLTEEMSVRTCARALQREMALATCWWVVSRQ